MKLNFTLALFLLSVISSIGQTNAFLNQSQAVITESIIGYTYYDNQSEGSIGMNLVRNQDGSFSAAWTYSPDSLSQYPNRGTAYNYYDPGATTISKWYYHPDGVAGVYPSARTEGNYRTGFTNIVVTDNGSEMSIANCTSLGTHRLFLNWRATKGPGSPWIQQPNALGTSANDDTWAKACSAGNTVYVLAHGTGNTGTSLYGQDGPILFSRSDDAGQTWPVLRQSLALIDSSQYNGFGAGNYFIDAKDSIVAIVFGNLITDLGILKSYDYGNTWTKTIVKTFPIPRFDFNTDFTYLPSTGPALDTMLSNYGDATLLIDNNGLCHVWYGSCRWTRDSSTAPGFYRPFVYLSDGLYYWNENMPTDSSRLIARIQDLNGNGQIDYPVAQCNYPWGDYGDSFGMTTRPSAGVDENNAIYVSYMSLVEANFADTTLWHELHTHIFVIGSADEGQTWTSPIDIVRGASAGGSGEYQDAAYGSMARRVVASEGPSILYQRDSLPGSVVSNFICHPIKRPNEIVFAQVQVPVGTSNITADDNNSSIVFPNPVSENSILEIRLNKNSDLVLNVYDVLGKKVIPELKMNGLCGTHHYPIDFASLGKGVYFYSIRMEDSKICGKFIKSQ